jgi:ribonuclease D
MSKLTNKDLDKLPMVQFEKEIVVVDTAEKLQQAVEEMSTASQLGFDTETRPSFKRGVSYSVSLLQLSVDNKAWLIRLNKIGMTKDLTSLLESKEILKIGVAIRDDIKGLQKQLPFTPANFIDLQVVAKERGLEDFSLKKLAAHVMGVKISKRQRLSNWEADHLSLAQQRYAATDAWVSLQIYKGLLAGVIEHERVVKILTEQNIQPCTE